MTPTTPSPANANASAPAPSPDGVTAAFDDLAESVDRALQNAAKLAAGTYSASDAADDLSWYSTKAMGWAKDAMGCWAELASAFVAQGGTPRFPVPDPTITATIESSVTNRPITLAAQSFRAVGWGNTFVIAATAVAFTNGVLAQGETDVTFTVDSGALLEAGRRRTLVFEGVIVDQATGAPLTDTIRFVRPADPPSP
jgi:hypothetical protein